MRYCSSAWVIFTRCSFDDAKDAARLLGLTLTSRNHGKTSGEVPLAGVPHHAMENYLAKLIQMGRKVAICEQVEDPKQAKGVVKRDVVRLFPLALRYPTLCSISNVITFSLA